MDLRKLSAFFSGDLSRCRDCLGQALDAEGIARPNASVTSTLESALAQRLFGITNQILVAQYRLLGDIAFDDYCAQLDAPATRAYLFAAYPSLQPCMEQACARWVSQCVLLLGRLARDIDAIGERLPGTGQGSALETVRLGMGDLHRGGGSVAVLTFTNGGRLVYKPRSLAIDEALSALIAEVAATMGAEPWFRVPACIDGGDYGWSEFIEAASPAPGGDTRAYFHALGHALCMLHVLNAGDIHRENIIAQGPVPVLVDVETLFRPVCETGGSEINELYDTSVLRTGVLPTRFLNGTGDQGGIAGMLAGTEAGPAPDDIKAMQAGYESLYMAILSDREGFSAALERFANAEIRVLFRHTAAYAQLLSSSYHPLVMRNGDGRRAHFARLRRAIEEFHAIGRFVDYEIGDLLHGDVPLLTARVAGRDLFVAPGRAVPNFFALSGLDAVRLRLADMDREDMARQSWMIQAACRLHRVDAVSPVIGPHGDASALAPVPMAVAIAGQLRSAMHVHGGRATWLVPKTRSLDGRDCEMVPAFCDLHGGMPGEILFFQKLAAVTGDGQWRDLAHAALAELIAGIRAPARASSIRSLGLYTGWGGVLFMLARLAREDCCPLYLDWALELVDSRDIAALVPGDRSYSLVSGAAGLVVALLDLHADTGNAECLQLALAAGSHLLRNRIPDVEGSAWRIQSRLPLAGMAHGASGIATALARLYAATGDESYHRAVLGALAFERSLLVDGDAGWRDCRDVVMDTSNAPVVSGGWAHGPEGVGIARLVMKDCGISHPFIGEDIAVARRALLALDPDHAGHSMLGGLAGSLEFSICLIERGLADAGIRAHLDRCVGILLARLQAGDARLAHTGGQQTGLLPGLTGVAYQCLRVESPGSVPSLLGGHAPWLAAGHRLAAGLRTGTG